MNGMRMRLETKPGKSFASAGVLPSSRASSTMAAAVSSDVCGARMTSTRDITGTGLKKCMPITCVGRAVAADRVVIGMDEVFDARMASGGRIASAILKISTFTSASSTTASIMSSASTMPSTGSTRASTSSGSAPPFSASFSRLRRIVSMPRSTAPGAASWSETRRPDAASTWAMPPPIWPAPTTSTWSKGTRREANVPRGTMDQHDGRWESALSELPRTRRHLFLRAYGDEVNRLLLRRWLPKSAGRVLKTDLFEEAVGDGLAPLLGERFQRVDAIDVSRAVVDEAARRHPEVNVVCCDVRELPYEDGTFDAVVSTSTLDHFENVADIAAALRELRRVLAPGGTLIVSLDNPANPLVAMRNALPFRWLHRIGLVPHYVGATCRPGELQKLLAQRGVRRERDDSDHARPPCHRARGRARDGHDARPRAPGTAADAVSHRAVRGSARGEALSVPEGSLAPGARPACVACGSERSRGQGSTGGSSSWS